MEKGAAATTLLLALLILAVTLASSLVHIASTSGQLLTAHEKEDFVFLSNRSDSGFNAYQAWVSTVVTNDMFNHPAVALINLGTGGFLAHSRDSPVVSQQQQLTNDSLWVLGDYAEKQTFAEHICVFNVYQYLAHSGQHVYTADFAEHPDELWVVSNVSE